MENNLNHQKFIKELLNNDCHHIALSLYSILAFTSKGTFKPLLRERAKKLKVSRNTLAKGLKDLESVGFIRRLNRTTYEIYPFE